MFGNLAVLLVLLAECQAVTSLFAPRCVNMEDAGSRSNGQILIGRNLPMTEAEMLSKRGGSVTPTL